MEKWPIGVFTSIDAGLGIDLDIVQQLSIPTLQLHAPSPDKRNDLFAQQIRDKLDANGLTVTAVFGGFEGESYHDIPTVEKTVGLVPDATRASRLAEMKQISDFSKSLGCEVVALHLGFVPHDVESADYREVVDVTRELCEYCSANDQNLHLETGQETAAALIRFINDTCCDNLFVNFDPANMILYGTGEPIEALKAIGDRVRSVHLKDANWSESPGKTWGEEVPLGEGQVNIPIYLNTLLELGYAGPLTIEREIPQEPSRQLSDIGHAVTLLNELKSRLLN